MRAYLLVLVPALAIAQLVERPVAFDDAGKTFVVSRALAEQAGLFPGLAGFDELRAWESDSGMVLEVLNLDGTRVRRPLAREELDFARQRLAELAATQPVRLNQEGRGSFLLQQIPLALGAYGPGVTLSIDPQDGRAFTALYLLSASGSYFGSLVLSNAAPMTLAQTHLTVAYGYRGAAAGLLLGSVLDSYEHPLGNFARGGLLLAGTAGGQLGGYALSRKYGLGQAAMVSTFTDFGMMDGLVAAVALRKLLNRDIPDRYLEGGALVGEFSGAVLGNLHAPRYPWSEGHATVIRTAGMAGAAACGALYYAVTGLPGQTGHVVAATLSSIGGNVAATWLAERDMRQRSVSAGGGYIVAGTTIGGALLGAGIGYAATTEGRVVAATGILGGIGGFLFGRKLALELQARQTPGSQSRASIEFNLPALAAAAVEYSGNHTFTAPNVVTVRF